MKRGAQDRISTKNYFSEREGKIGIFSFSGTELLNHLAMYASISLMFLLLVVN